MDPKQILLLYLKLNRACYPRREFVESLNSIEEIYEKAEADDWIWFLDATGLKGLVAIREALSHHRLRRQKVWAFARELGVDLAAISNEEFFREWQPKYDEIDQDLLRVIKERLPLNLLVVWITREVSRAL